MNEREPRRCFRQDTQELFKKNFKTWQQFFLTEVNHKQVKLLAFFYFSNKEIVSKTKLIKLLFMRLLKINVFKSGQHLKLKEQK